MKKYFSKDQLLFYKGEVERINNDPDDKYFRALLAIYDKLYSEILSWGTHSANITIGFLVILITGILYGIAYDKPLILAGLPLLFGVLCIISNLVFIWMSTLAFKMAEIEICFRKAKMPLFNWLTEHNVLSPTYTPTHRLVIFIIIIYPFLFVLGFVLTISQINVIIMIFDAVIAVGIVIVTRLLLLRYNIVKNQVKELQEFLKDQDY